MDKWTISNGLYSLSQNAGDITAPTTEAPPRMPSIFSLLLQILIPAKTECLSVLDPSTPGLHLTLTSKDLLDERMCGCAAFSARAKGCLGRRASAPGTSEQQTRATRLRVLDFMASTESINSFMSPCQSSSIGLGKKDTCIMPPLFR